jgi:hypothetical protein
VIDYVKARDSWSIARVGLADAHTRARSVGHDFAG